MGEPPPSGEPGCAGLLAATLVVLIGYLATGLGRLGEVASGQRAPAEGDAAWAALLVGGAVAPAAALIVARRSRRVVIGLSLWMLVALFAACGLAINSGGGV